MKKLLSSIALAVATLSLSASAQTNNPPVNLWDILGGLSNGSNYFGVVYGTADTSAKDFGGGVAVGYKATEALAVAVRLDDFAGKVYLANIGVQLSVPRSFMGKVPFVPFTFAAAGVPLSTESLSGGITISAGDPVAIVGVGAYVPLSWVGSGKFWQKTFLVGDYEHWTGAGIPANQQEQVRAGMGFSF